MKKRPFGICDFFLFKLSFLKFNYRLFSTFTNSNVPSWLQVSIKKNIIEFSGIPEEKDVGEFLIQIIDESDFIVREFELIVKSN